MPAREQADSNRLVIEEFRAAGGTVGGQFAGLPLLLLTTVGARSGRRRTVPLTYVVDGDHYLIAAGAADANPAWYHNVRAHSAVTVEIGTEVFNAVARVTAGSERAVLFGRYAADQPQLLSYQDRASRQVPIVVLTRSNRGPVPDSSS